LSKILVRKQPLIISFFVYRETAWFSLRICQLDISPRYEYGKRGQINSYSNRCGALWRRRGNLGAVLNPTVPRRVEGRSLVGSVYVDAGLYGKGINAMLCLRFQSSNLCDAYAWGRKPTYCSPYISVCMPPSYFPSQTLSPSTFSSLK